MASTEELQRLIVRLEGNAKDYESMLRKSNILLKKFTASTKKETVKQVAAWRRANKAITASLLKTSRKMKSIGTRMTIGVTAPVVAMGVSVVKTFADFDQAMVASTSIMKVTEKQTQAMREEALRLSKSGEIPQGPKQLAEAYFFLASAGKDAEQSMSLLLPLAKFAAAGNFEMALATDLATDAQSALGLASKNAAEDTKNLIRVTDVFVRANTLANTSVQQISEAITNQAGASLKAFNKDLEEGVAVLAAYADQGIKGQVAGSTLSRVILLMSKSALDQAEAHKKLGFQVFDSTGKMRNFADIIENLEKLTAGMSDKTKAATLAQLGFAARVQQAILPLLGTSDAIRRYERELRIAGGTTERVSDKQMKSLANRMKALSNSFKAAKIELATSFAPELDNMIVKLREGVKWWDELDESTKKSTAQIALWTAALGPAALALSVAGFALAGVNKLLLSAPWIALAAAMVKVGLEVRGLIKDLKDVEESNKAVASAQASRNKEIGFIGDPEKRKETREREIARLESKIGRARQEWARDNKFRREALRAVMPDFIANQMLFQDQRLGKETHGKPIQKMEVQLGALRREAAGDTGRRMSQRGVVDKTPSQTGPSFKLDQQGVSGTAGEVAERTAIATEEMTEILKAMARGVSLL